MRIFPGTGRIFLQEGSSEHTKGVTKCDKPNTVLYVIARLVQDFSLPTGHRAIPKPAPRRPLLGRFQMVGLATMLNNPERSLLRSSSELVMAAEHRSAIADALAYAIKGFGC